MMSYFLNKEEVVRFVERALASSSKGFALTMTIGRDTYGDYFAHTVIDELSAGTGLIVAQNSSKPLMNISQESTQVG